MIPFSGTASWIESLLFVAAAAVLALYVFQIFLPKIKQIIGTESDPEERAAELLAKYRRRQTNEHKGNSSPQGKAQQE